MTRAPKRKVSGWIVLDKPAGISSTQASTRVRHIFNAEKAGHFGTLDPIATGVLAVALGEATKTLPFIQDETKSYRFEIVFGSATDTGDSEGKITATSDRLPSLAEVHGMAPKFRGVQTQIPPIYSAIKIDGQRAYKLARAGETPEIPSRSVEITRLEVMSMPAPDRAVLEVDCSKGTYIRSLARDLAQALDTQGHIGALRRLRAGPFALDRSVTLEALEKSPMLLPLDAALGQVPEIFLDSAQAGRVRLGNPVLLTGRAAPVSLASARAYEGRVLVALGEVSGGQFRPKRLILNG
jgi:tRNA pseudouridine55 synthase